jgi:hypothetical protein
LVCTFVFAFIFINILLLPLFKNKKMRCKGLIIKKCMYTIKFATTNCTTRLMNLVDIFFYLFKNLHKFDLLGVLRAANVKHVCKIMTLLSSDVRCKKKKKKCVLSERTFAPFFPFHMINKPRSTVYYSYYPSNSLYLIESVCLCNLC